MTRMKRIICLFEFIREFREIRGSTQDRLCRRFRFRFVSIRVHSWLVRAGSLLRRCAAWLLALCFFGCFGCAHPRRSYAPTDEFFASGRFPVPAEFRRGTASRSEVEAWSISLLGDHPLEISRTDLDGDGVGELFVSEPAHRGTGGNFYLVFREGRRGFRYLGRLFFGMLRPLTLDRAGRARVLTSSSAGGGECMVTIHILQPDGFQSAASRVLPCGDSASDGEGGREIKRLFESEPLSETVLREVFGTGL
jgi:hypothetical protein